MQRGMPIDKAKKRRHLRMRHGSSAAGPQPSRPAAHVLIAAYGVHMRNTATGGRGTWAALVQAAREAVGLSKAELARRLRVDRATIMRWESGTTKPESGEMVQRFAALFAIDLDEALAAAGLRPEGPTPTMPEPLHPDIQRLVDRLGDPATNEETKAYIMSTLRYLAELPPAPRRTRRAG